MDKPKPSQVENPANPVGASSSDYLVRWPLIAALLGLVGFVVMGAWPDWSILLIFGPLPALFAANIVAVIGLLVSARKRRWRKTVSFAALPIIACCSVLGNIGKVGAYIRIRAAIDQYQVVLDKLPNDGERFQIFDWAGFAGWNTSLIYDESDRIANPASKQDWGYQAAGIAQRCAGRVAHITGHYYLCNW